MKCSRLSGGSIGYTVDNYKRIADVNPDDDSDEDYLGTFSAERWTPYEYSLTPIEADVTSGVGRSADLKFPVRFTGAPEEAPKVVPNPAPQETRMSEVAVLNNDALKAERTRCAAISLLQRNYPDLATRELADK